MATFPKKKSRPWIPKKAKMEGDPRIIPPRSYKHPEIMQFYGSKRWKSIRNYYYQMNPLCEECERNGFIMAGTDVDHIKPIRLGGGMVDINNLQTLCKGCHARKSGRESQIGSFKK